MMKNLLLPILALLLAGCVNLHVHFPEAAPDKAASAATASSAGANALPAWCGSIGRPRKNRVPP